MRSESQHRRKSASVVLRRALVGAGVMGAMAACGDVPVESDTFPPQGNFRGNVTYSGPLPCTQNITDPTTGAVSTHVMGAAVLLVFNENLLPPPEGFGTTAAQFATVAGDTLFQSITNQLPAPEGPNGIACPDPNSTQTITLSAPFTIGPVPAGRYQIRGFYDYDGDFAPLEKIHNLPTAGDIGGGAISNVADALAGKPVHFQTFEVGEDYDGTGNLVIPDSGALVDNIGVSLGQKLAFARPIFNYASVVDQRPSQCPDPTNPMGPKIPCDQVCLDPNSMTNGKVLCSTLATPPPVLTPNPQTDPSHIVMARDERFAVSPTNTANTLTADDQFVRVHFGASVPMSEQSTGAGSPYFLQVQSPWNKLYTYANLDDNGVPKPIPESPASLIIADMFPQVIFGKLDERDTRKQTAQPSPAVVIQGVVMNQKIAPDGTISWGLLNTLSSQAPKSPVAVDEIVAGVRPSVICLDPLDVNATVYVVTPSFQSLDGDTVIDPSILTPRIVAQLGNRPNVAVVEGCLPTGLFQANLVYPTGQAWTVPNEAGTCMPLEDATSSGGCHEQGQTDPRTDTRTVLPSQETVLTIQGERQSGYCDSLKPPMDHPELTYVHGVPTVCLRADEIP